MILISPYQFLSISPQALADAFNARVVADGGTYEGDACLVSELGAISSFYTRFSIALISNGYGPGKIYLPLPITGAGDLVFSRGTTRRRKGKA